MWKPNIKTILWTEDIWSYKKVGLSGGPIYLYRKSVSIGPIDFLEDSFDRMIRSYKEIKIFL